MKDGSMRQVKHIMESVAVRSEDVVRERITNKYAIPLQITPPAFPLCDFDLKNSWEAAPHLGSCCRTLVKLTGRDQGNARMSS